MRIGIIVLNIFAAAWAVAAILSAHLPVWLAAGPVLLSAALIAWTERILRHVAPRPDADRVGRLVSIWSAIEGVAILVIVTVLQNVGMDDSIGPAIAIVVGLHFFPLARGIPVPLYYLTGAAMVGAGAAALLLPAAERLPGAGFASALILWLSVAAIIRRNAASRASCEKVGTGLSQKNDATTNT